MFRRPLLLIGAVLLSACATIPSPLQGEFAPASPATATAEGIRVRWGGEIIEVRPGREATCFEILARTLGASARPRAGDAADGRFLACRAGFYDPAIFRQGRELTVTGRVEGSEERLIGEYAYRLPRVAADVIYLWPEREPRAVYWAPYDPFWPYYGYHGPFGPVIRWHRVPRAAPAPQAESEPARGAPPQDVD